jgi:adenylate kinase family enzyme
LGVTGDDVPKLVNRSQIMVILITGPAGSGKTTLARRIATNDGWVHISEDDLWNEIGHPSHEPRNDEGQMLVHSKAQRRIDEGAWRRQNAVLEFLIYEDPPRRLRDYQHFLEQRSIPFVTRVLRPGIETILERQRIRGRPSDRDYESRRRHGEHQLKCLNSVMIHADWVIDSSHETAEQTYSTHFMHLVEACRAPGA